MALRSLLAALLSLVVSLALVGCAKPWVVVRQASPNPMAATSRFSVTKLTFDNLQVGTKSDKEYAEEKESKTADAWQGDKVEMTQAFATAFLDAQAPLQTGDGGDFVVKVNCAYIEPGFYAYVASAPADIRIRATILNKAGAVVDEIELRTSSSDMAKRTRLRNAARSAGAGLAKYLHERLSL